MDEVNEVSDIHVYSVFNNGISSHVKTTACCRYSYQLYILNPLKCSGVSDSYI